MPITAPAPSPAPSPEIASLIAAGRFSSVDLPYGFKPFGFPNALDQFVEVPVPTSRAERKLQKADARRVARERKLEGSIRS